MRHVVEIVSSREKDIVVWNAERWRIKEVKLLQFDNETFNLSMVGTSLHRRRLRLTTFSSTRRSHYHHHHGIKNKSEQPGFPVSTRLA